METIPETYGKQRCGARNAQAVSLRIAVNCCGFLAKPWSGIGARRGERVARRMCRCMLPVPGILARRDHRCGKRRNKRLGCNRVPPSIRFLCLACQRRILARPVFHVRLNWTIAARFYWHADPCHFPIPSSINGRLRLATPECRRNKPQLIVHDSFTEKGSVRQQSLCQGANGVNQLTVGN